MCCICKCAVAIIGLVIKICLYIFNVFFWLAGCSMLGYGIYLASEKVTTEYAAIFEGMETTMWEAVVGLMITLGILIVSAGILGCCGSCKGSRCLWLCYIGAMGLILALMISVVSLAAVQQTNLKTYMDKNLPGQIYDEYDVAGNGDLTKAWDALQKDGECCGALNYKDYQNSTFWEQQPEPTVIPSPATGEGYRRRVPESCCVRKDGEIVDLHKCQFQAHNEDEVLFYVHSKGCIDTVEKSVDDTATGVYATMFTVGIFVVLCMLMGFCKCCGVDKDDKDNQVA